MGRQDRSLLKSLPSSLIIFLFCTAIVFGGVVGMSMILAMLYSSERDLLVDNAEKHGISEKKSSRFGGVLVFFGSIAYWLVNAMIQGNGGQGALDNRFLGFEPVVLLIGCVGLWEDSTGRLSPLVRLTLLFFFVGGYFLLNPDRLPTEVFSSNFPQILNHEVLIGLGVTVCVVGFINAGNIADGANGLLSVVALAVCTVGYLQSGNLVYYALLASLVIFIMFNITTGLIFLGDFGSYALSALMALTCVELYSSGTSSVWFYACLVSYPCVELLRVMILRRLRGKSPMEADDSHLHNYLFTKLKSLGFTPLLANTYTGLSIAILSTFVPLAAFFSGISLVDPGVWFSIFASYCIVHLAICFYISESRQSRVK